MRAQRTSLTRSARPLLTSLLLAAVTVATPPASAQQKPSFLAFESGQVRPLAMTPSGDRLLAVNTPDNRLEIFAVARGGISHLASVPVGMEPVAVAARDNSEAWVVNHLSDSVSIVDLEATPPRVVRTLLVGDEPRDIVFAGTDRNRAFITTAHRGQHLTHPSLRGVPGAGDPQLTTAGIGRADVWVFDANRLDGSGDPQPEGSLGGIPLRIVNLFGDTPRALAVSNNGSTVWAAVFKSGNGSTTIPEEAVCDGFSQADAENACPEEFAGSPGGVPGPATNHEGAPAPEVGLIAQHDPESGEWHDALGRDWSHAVRFDLPDLDVFAIDARSLEPISAYSRVGTALFNMVAHPTESILYVSNTEARNVTSFEGPGVFGDSTVQGRLHEARVTVIRQMGGGADVQPRHLNKHIDYSLRPAPYRFKRHTLATPTGMAVSSDGSTLYVAAFGSSKIGVFPTVELEADTFDPRRLSSGYLELAGGGPTGLVLDEERGRIYVLTRFDNAVASLDLAGGAELQRLPLHNPEPAVVRDGRRFLYDAKFSSSNGEASCSSCHLFGDLDGLAWNLGDPDGNVTRSPIPQLRSDEARMFDPPINGTGDPLDFHPMKGPMTTQTLRGLAVSGSLHWRGDRSNGAFGVDAGDTDLAFRNFIVAFPGLVGRKKEPTDGQMQKFSDFALSMVLPPNPIRRLDNTFPAEDQATNLFTARALDNGGANLRCGECHGLEPLIGQFGTKGLQTFQGTSQIFKAPHLRNLYQKVGMFGMTPTSLVLPGDDVGVHQGPQVRGFGFLHDGSIDTIFRFLRTDIFLESDGVVQRTGFENDDERRALEAMMLAFPSDLAPVVAQQVTMSAENATAARQRLALLLERAQEGFASRILGGVVTECDLIAKGVVEGEARGWFFRPVERQWASDRVGEASLTRAQMRALATAPGNAMTFTCAPPGSGERMALDRDEDGAFDGDERDAGTNPNDPADFPGAPQVTVEPLTRQLGNHEIGSETFDNVEVENRGTAILNISRIRLTGRDKAAYALSAGRDNCTGTRLRPGETCVFRATFTPTSEGQKRAVAVVVSDDPEAPRLRVLLRGTGVTP